MSVFGAIMSKIFHHPKAQVSTPAAPAQTAPAATAPQPTPPQATPATPAASAAASQPTPVVDVADVLESMARDSSEALDWRRSIVDLLKLLAIDPSLANRKALAGELGYGGDTSDSAAMNIWLHRAVMQKLAENGGIVPDSLR